MNSNAAANKTRMLQLLADRATEGLDMDATKNLNELLSSVTKKITLQNMN